MFIPETVPEDTEMEPDDLRPEQSAPVLVASGKPHE